MTTLTDQLPLFPIPDLHSHAAVFDITDGPVVILASVPTSIPTTKTTVALVRHRKGYVPHLGAVTVARKLAEKTANEVIEK